jgi:methylenetetrahydrofolate dehydrogenase (NADP+)/methenyltetrahydrofolate cyclohydrolase
MEDNMAKLLSGKDVVAAMNEKLTAEVETLKSKGISPTLAILRVGERPDDISYEKGATKRCETVGVGVKNVVLPADVTQEELMKNIEVLNNDKNVHGVLIFRPLPKHLDDEAVRKALRPEKDIDGITDGSLAGVFTGSGEGYAPCTAQACMESLIITALIAKAGAPRLLAQSRRRKTGAIMLMGRHATVTVCHTRTVDMPSVARNAEY